MTYAIQIEYNQYIELEDLFHKMPQAFYCAISIKFFMSLIIDFADSIRNFMIEHITTATINII